MNELPEGLCTMFLTSKHNLVSLWYGGDKASQELDIARAKGMTQVAKDAGLSRESLYRALSEDGNSSLATILKVSRALGVKFNASVI